MSIFSALNRQFDRLFRGIAARNPDNAEAELEELTTITGQFPDTQAPFDQQARDAEFTGSRDRRKGGK